ncbi:MAG: hypothetical protein KAQ98_02995 [Bacteriovoracaceae bacterium]|nr:hypothetical protein [Bacteriovoracaceae bacterium]
MGNSLKDALKKAGFKASRQENERPMIKRKKKTKVVKHQEERNFCEVCKNVCPDVELYKHRNPTVDAQWICARCADIHQIPDSTRKSSQSDFAKKGMFRREFI